MMGIKFCGRHKIEIEEGHFCPICLKYSKWYAQEKRKCQYRVRNAIAAFFYCIGDFFLVDREYFRDKYDKEHKDEISNQHV